MQKKTSTKAVETVQPSKWYYQEMWRRLFAHEVGSGQKMRRALVDQSMYPIPGGDFPAQAANNRAALHDIIDELGHDDLQSVFNVARSLLLEPDSGDVVKYSQAHEEHFRETLKERLLDGGDDGADG